MRRVCNSPGGDPVARAAAVWNEAGAELAPAALLFGVGVSVPCPKPPWVEEAALEAANAPNRLLPPSAGVAGFPKRLAEAAMFPKGLYELPAELPKAPNGPEEAGAEAPKSAGVDGAEAPNGAGAAADEACEPVEWARPDENVRINSPKL